MFCALCGSTDELSIFQVLGGGSKDGGSGCKSPSPQPHTHTHPHILHGIGILILIRLQKIYVRTSYMQYECVAFEVNCGRKCITFVS